MKNIDYQSIIESIIQDIQPYAKIGKQADYIPALAEVNPDQFGMCISTTDGQVFSAGDTDALFSIQSISKVFMLAACLSLEGDKLWERMGKEPSGSAFNSLIQLEMENGIPRNPFINPGAIVMADILTSHLKNPERQFLDFVTSLCGSQFINYNIGVAHSERETGFLNAAITNLLKHHGNIENDIEKVLTIYCVMCSIEMTCQQLSQAFLNFANHSQPFQHAGINLSSSQIKRINAIMQTCGFYNEAGDYSYLVGLPGKSGVGGGIAAIYPSRYAVAAWSPRLNEKGNSVMGMKALELLTTKADESIF